jgi:hypothetical protein
MERIYGLGIILKTLNFALDFDQKIMVSNLYM